MASETYSDIKACPPVLSTIIREDLDFLGLLVSIQRIFDYGVIIDVWDRLTLAAPIIVYRVLDDRFVSNDGEFVDFDQLTKFRFIAFGVFAAVMAVFWVPLIIWKSVVSHNCSNFPINRFAHVM